MAWRSETTRATKRRSSFRHDCEASSAPPQTGRCPRRPCIKWLPFGLRRQTTVSRFRNFLKSVIGFYPPIQILMFYELRIIPYIYGRPLISLFIYLFICLFKEGISTDKTVYLKRSYAKGKKKKRKKRRKVIRW